MTMLILALVLLLAGGGMALAGVLSGGGNTGSDAVAVEDARLPELGDAVPVLASLSEDCLLYTSPSPRDRS